jgi:cytidylate kinase
MLKLSKGIPVQHLISRQLQFWEMNHRERTSGEKQRVLPSITISREIGCQGEELAQRLGERLGWQVFDREIVEYIANNAHVRKEMVEMFDGKTRNELNNWILTILDQHALSSDRYFQHLVTTITSIARHGRAIILGRGANFILPDENALKLRIAAPLKNRIQYVAKLKKIGEDVAVGQIKKAEHEHEAFIKQLFHDTPNNHLNYDLVLNLGKMDFNTAEETIITAFMKKFNQPANDSVDLKKNGSSYGRSGCKKQNPGRAASGF